MISLQARAKCGVGFLESSAHVLISFYVIAKYGAKMLFFKGSPNKYTNRHSYYGKEDIL